MRDTPLLAELYEELTGIEVSPRELKKRGKKVWAMEKLLNIREGWTRGDDEIPPQWLENIETPLKLRSGGSYLRNWLGKRISKTDLEEILNHYYDEQGWDPKTGIPTKEKLIELGLGEYVNIVERILGER